jgi:hypothetical protein
LAFQSNESGRFEVYVIPFPSGTGKWQISAAGGFIPHWRGDGKELYYLSPDFKVMAVPVDADGTFHAGSPAPLFDVHPNGNVFDVAADGKRFLVNSAPTDVYSQPLTLIVNWPATLRRK